MKRLLLFMMLALTLSATAQKDDPKFPKFGKVTEQDFQHTPIDDLGYDAVVLVNEKSMYFDVYNGQLRLYHVVHTRLKALKDGFKDDDFFTIRYSGMNEYEKLLSPRCWVYKLNGKKITTEKSKMKDIIYIDRDSVESRTEITPPPIQKGDIIDIDYTLITFNYTLPPVFKLSCKYPCTAARLTGNFPYFMKYKYDTKGIHSDQIQHDEATDSFANINYTYSSTDNPKSLNYVSGIPEHRNFIYKFGAYQDTYTMTNIPPEDSHEAEHVSHLYGTAAVRMRASKFTQDIGYTEDYFTAWQQLTHLIYTYANPDYRYLPQIEIWEKPYNPGYVLVAANSWDRLYKQQRRNPQFWKPMQKEITLPDEIKSLRIPDMPLDTLAVSEKIFNYVIQNIAWDSTFNNHTTRPIESVIKSKRGNSAEINMTLITLLRRTGVSAIAAMATTRDFGEVDTAYANISQFNSVLACVPYEDRLILLDATDPKKQFGKVTPKRYDSVMWFMSPFKYFFGDAEYTDDKNYTLKKISEEK